MYSGRDNGFGTSEPTEAEDWEGEIAACPPETGQFAEMESISQKVEDVVVINPEAAQSGSEGGDTDQNDEPGESVIIEVNSRDVRHIIGRGGSKIRELEQDSGCKIKISKELDDGVKAGIELVGTEEEQKLAEEMISDVVSSSHANSRTGSGMSRNLGGFGRSRGGFQGGSSNSGDTLEVEISSRDIARIIGRGGSKIRELQEESSTRIHINKDKDNGVTAVVEIRGSEEGQQIAKQLIEDLTSSHGFYGSGGESYSRGRSDGGSHRGFGGITDWGADSLEMDVASRDVSRIIGRGGSKIQEVQERSGTRIKINKDRDDGVRTVVEIRGTEEGQQMAKELIEEMIASQNSYGSGGESYGRGRNGGEAQYDRGGFGGRRDWGRESLEIEVASSDVSRIIGKRGSRIQEMQDKSGTRIRINKERDDGVTTIVEIRGSEEGQQMAKELIEELTSSQNTFAYGSGGGPQEKNGDEELK